MIIINSSDINLSLKSFRNVCILIIITALCLIIRESEIPFTYGVSFTMAGVFLFIILRYYGWIIASSAVIVINIFDWCFFNGSIYTIFLFLEVLVVGILWRDKKRNLFLLDLLFWCGIGTPLAALLFYFKTKGMSVEGWLLVTNISINGLLNVIIADIIISYIPIQRIFGNKEKRLVDLNKMIFHLTVAAVLGPFLVYTMVDAWSSRENIDNDINQKLNTTSLNITEELKSWEVNDIRKLRLRSPFHIKNFKAILDNNPFNDSIDIFIVDKNHNIYIKNNKTEYEKSYNWKEGGEYTEVNKGIYKWLPLYKGVPYDLSRWSQAFYIKTVSFDDVDLELLIKLPLSNYTGDIWKTSLKKFLILLLSWLISALISIMTSRFVSKDLSKLTRISTGLPDKLKRQEEIEWPQTSINQVNSLVSNFQAMSFNLVKLFNESKVMNNQLMYQKKELEVSREKMKTLAYNDALTGLPNRLGFTGYLEGLLNSPNVKNIAVMFVDLNRFKQINDTLGHEFGDMLIKEVANRFGSFMKDDSFVARLGGDEFVIVLNNADKKKAKKAGIYVNKILAEPVFIHQNDHVHELYVSGSVGISMYPEDALEKTTLLKYADLAMYAAKESGDNTFRFYSELAESNVSEQLLLEQSLCKALERNELVIYYQPKINVESRSISGMEALIRWNHPQRGLILPMQFISLAEETGIINRIGEWVIIEACKQNKSWQDKGYPKARVSVNLSLRQFYANNIVNIVRKALEISGLEPEYLELEITEGVLMKNTEYIISVLHELRSMGVYISIDDFGIGYSSFWRLKELPIQVLKIDKSFIKDIMKEKINSSIVSAIIQLAHSMDIDVVAEGVETIEEFNSLELINCDEVQGYLFSKPIPASDFEKLIRSFKFPIFA